ncbi:MAG TPA: Cof-type HAD-IIB family hydrolase [Candidatus Butyricicoccus avistercoris]|uniref:Cof-type HAD-IIB family hydrolase n=1 Tax=Candidatus Butyricicoccus avistercoris TaxID=2838518 RepID=A0A9D1TGV8_9FIRM|nr:Cof-type HAD-IIB family hydrolase [Candidatus Butyricicoccus avistercoris]
MIRAAFFDIDGTLLSFNTHQVPEATKKALYALRDMGIKLFVATGRAPQTATYLREVFDFEFDGYIYLNGQMCYIGDKMIHSHTIPKSSIEMLLPYIKEKKIACSFIEAEHHYLGLENEHTQHFNKMLGGEKILGDVEDTQRALENDVYQLGAFMPIEQDKEFLEHLPHCRCTRWHHMFADVIPVDGGKNVGMDKILEYFNIPLEQSIAFGDGGNDIEMISHANIGVAMGNAMEDVKQAADFVTKHVDENGVSYALDKLGILPFNY